MSRLPNDVRDDLRLVPEPEGSETTPEPLWPKLGEEAVYGLAGRVANTVGPHTEADTAAVLFTLLSAVGNAIGRGSYVEVGADRHHAKVNVVVVGKTSKARKGMSWSINRRLMHAADPAWEENRVLNGLSSGEGLIQAVRDPVYGTKKGEEVLLDSGEQDKRLFVMEQEFAGPLKVASREGNTLSPIARQAWDDVTLRTMTKNSPSKATESHVTICGHITQDELHRSLTQTESANGFANRFTWVLAKRSKALPFGGDLNKVNMAPLTKMLREAVDHGKGAGRIGWGDSARPVWEAVYEELSEGDPGLFGAVTSRSEAQVLRMALVYAVLDFSTTLEEPHLRAALAAWDYSRDSARYIFGDATGDEVADKALEELRRRREEGMTGTEIYRIWNGRRKKEQIQRALEYLRKLGRVRAEKTETGGRPQERWYAKG